MVHYVTMVFLSSRWEMKYHSPFPNHSFISLSSLWDWVVKLLGWSRRRSCWGWQLL